MKLVFGLCVIFCLFSCILSGNIGDGRIFNGQDYYNAKLFVGIGLMKLAGTTEVVRAGGTLITTTHLLTAASNIKGYKQWNIYPGSPNGYESTTTIAICHEGYVDGNNGGIRNNDIGIIFLLSPVGTSSVVTLPEAAVTLTYPNNALDITIHGVSEVISATPPSVLKYGTMRISSYTLCTFSKFNTANLFCSKDAYTNICNTDIGGPATQIINNKLTLVGIAAATGGCAANGGSIFTNIYPYRKWITGMTNDAV